MDALRLIKTARHALAEARSVPDALAEAWQAGLLTEAVGARIAERESGETGALGQLLCDAGAHTVGCLEQPTTEAAADDGADQEWSRGEWGGTGRAARLDELGELEPVLDELGRLLHEVAETLVVLACGADAESLYWRCIDGVDAGAECKDLVAELLRTVRKQSEDGGAESPDEGQDWYEDDDGEDWDHRRQRQDHERRDRHRHGAAAGGGLGLVAEPGAAGTGPVIDRYSEGSLPTLVIPLAPPGAACGYRPGPDESVELSAEAGSSAAPTLSTARPPENWASTGWAPIGWEPEGRSPADCVPEERRSAPSPARESLTEASSSCICSSRLLGVGAEAAVAAGTPVSAAVCGATGASDQISDMRGPLQLGSAV
ncbi:DUF6099 family protein [Kitasatospora sp. GP82]|uniref:DUF6099 family protein n=1 Tax=Kitasatospora sp. GP82 TaxID=3035089 RepID=UPI002474E7CE|nr:DUF6099 family protein [Kitasatospora sp. GP82]MDH6125126.1 hypothetical protein [Kitasatospora sp. GP82]